MNLPFEIKERIAHFVALDFHVKVAMDLQRVPIDLVDYIEHTYPTVHDDLHAHLLYCAFHSIYVDWCVHCFEASAVNDDLANKSWDDAALIFYKQEYARVMKILN